MSEQIILIDGERVAYDGIFSSQELFNVIKQWGASLGYNVIEPMHTESITSEGKFVDMNLEPFKKFTDYVKSKIKVRIQLNNVKDVVVVKDGKKTKLQEGKVMIIITAILETDYENRWESKPVFFVLRTIFHKYVYSSFISTYERDVKKDATKLRDELYSYLNLTKFT